MTTDETMEYRLAALEKAMQQFVSIRENELQLGAIRSSTERTERDMVTLKDQVKGIEDKLVKQGEESQKRDDAQSKSLDKLQLKILWSVVSAVGGLIIAVLSGILIYYATHLH